MLPKWFWYKTGLLVAIILPTIIFAHWRIWDKTYGEIWIDPINWGIGIGMAGIMFFFQWWIGKDFK